MADSSAGGTYTLVLSLPTRTTIDVGALGPLEFDEGWYAYTGSALGSGGFARVDRHREIAAGERSTRHWHVDYLLPETSVEEVVTAGGVDAECAIHREIVAADGVTVGARKFGASDCDCTAHLAYAPAERPLTSAVEESHGQVRRR